MRNNKTYIIAEIGINHNGLLESCFKLIDAAVLAGCDAAKFQFFKAAMLYPKSAGRLKWKNRAGRVYSYDIYNVSERFSMPEEWVLKLISYCRKRRIEFLSSVFDNSGVDLLINIGLKKIKLSSYTITHLPLIEHCARKQLPIIMSTGGASLSEIDEAVSVVRKYHNQISLLHCSLDYPTKLSDCNLGVIRSLAMAYPDITIGYSDHTKEVSSAAKQAVYLGARVIEKHITLDKTMDGPDHFFALNPAELKNMVEDIRKAEAEFKAGKPRINKAIYGKTGKSVSIKESYLRNFAFMKLYAKRNVPEGERISCRDVAVLRPGNKKHGLEPKYLSLFSSCVVTARRDIVAEDPITWDCIL